MIDFDAMNRAALNAFAQRVSINFGGGGYVDLLGVFDHQYVESDMITGYLPVLTCATLDIREVSVGDTYEIEEVEYTIRVSQPDTGGMTKLISERTG